MGLMSDLYHLGWSKRKKRLVASEAEYVVEAKESMMIERE